MGLSATTKFIRHMLTILFSILCSCHMATCLHCIRLSIYTNAYFDSVFDDMAFR